MSDKKPVVAHFEYTIHGTVKDITNEDCLFIINKFLDALQERGLTGGGGTFPCKGTECQRRKGHRCQ